ncbi:hypothetical protein CHS0354_027348, partial [Potamilus streckersoni]
GGYKEKTTNYSPIQADNKNNHSSNHWKLEPNPKRRKNKKTSKTATEQRKQPEKTRTGRYRYQRRSTTEEKHSIESPIPTEREMRNEKLQTNKKPPITYQPAKPKCLPPA